MVGYGTGAGTIKTVTDRCGGACDDDPDHHLDNDTTSSMCDGSITDLGVGRYETILLR